MEKELLNQIIIKYQQGEASPDEIKFIESYYQALQHRADRNGIGNQLPSAQTWSEIQQHIHSRIQPHGSTKTIKLWRRISIVAAAVGLIAIGIYFYVAPRIANQKDNNNYAADIAPGKQGATLTLANGEKIRLSEASNGQLARQAGVTISKTASGQLTYEFKPNNQVENNLGAINTLTTAKGETYQVRLPDGSLVWLNAASSLTYTAALTERQQRRVKLSGEAYFEVAKDKAHPFVVETRGQEVEVLGTHFNVNAYDDEPAIATTLLEGSVQIIAGKNLQKIKPGFQAINNNGSIKIDQADIDNVIDWKNGDFYFENADFRSVMRKIARWYDVEIVYDQNVPENITSNGVISRNNKLSAVLKSIEKSGQVHFKIENKRIIVSK
nr:FecR family protein [Pedobacter panaciterrae]